MSNFSKQDAIEDLKTLKAFFEEESGAFPVSLEYAINFLESDIIEVVRCKDCKHNHEYETSMGNKFHICNINKLAFTQYADFYCAYGERK